VADAPKNSWGLVRMDRTAKMQEELKKKKKKTKPRNLWRRDWQK
jgi:hypothetical protein